MAYENLSREDLIPGARFAFERFGDLHDFEDDLAPLVDPERVQAYWDVRDPTLELLSRMIDAQKLRLAIARPVLRVVDGDAYSRLQNAAIEGWEFGKACPARNDGTEKDFVGFALEALLTSTGKSAATASLQTRVWYAPVARIGRAKSAEARDIKGLGLTRIVAKPKVDALDAVATPPLSTVGRPIDLPSSRGVARFKSRPNRQPRY